MGGVVFAPGSITEGMYGPALALGAGAAIPPGFWFCPGAYVLTVPNAAGTGTTTVNCPGGLVSSDGTNATLTAAGNVTALGSRPPPRWPWIPPWPLAGHS